MQRSIPASARATYVSVLDLFSVGIGPSSSHTVGPMRAATAFVRGLDQAGLLDGVASVSVLLAGSLGATGEGHGTPDAVIAGLRGLDPTTCNPDELHLAWRSLGEGSPVSLLGRHEVVMASDDVRLAPLTRLPGHPNGMRFTAYGVGGSGSAPGAAPGAAPGERPVLAEQVWYSVGGGFIRAQEGVDAAGQDGDQGDGQEDTAPTSTVPFPFRSAAELLHSCASERIPIWDLAWAIECALLAAAGSDDPAADLAAGLDAIWRAMSDCIDAGLDAEGELPGRLHVRRRAAAQRKRLEELEAMAREGRHDDEATPGDLSIEWLQAYAMAINEENAGGRRVVTAPTNGAAGIVPAVGRHFLRTHRAIALNPERRATVMRRYLLVAGAIGALYKRNASISGAEAGCQGEVGSACSMAAGALAAVLGGSTAQIENAAEIAMEHNLGLTCDPVGGLVQVPCIERNAIAACTAVSAARLALQGDGSHVVSLDAVIETMRQTGLDMSTKYKETSTGGLAVNVVEC